MIRNPRQALQFLVQFQRELLSFAPKFNATAAWQRIAALLAEQLDARRVIFLECRYEREDAPLLQLLGEFHDAELAPMAEALAHHPMPAHQLLPAGWEAALTRGHILTGPAISPPESTGDAAARYLPLLIQGQLVGIWVLETHSPIQSTAPAELDLLRAVAADLALWTKQRRTEERLRTYASELRQHNEELDGFARMVAHDLKNPLAILSSTAQALSHMFADLSPAEVRELTEIIQEYADKAIDIVDELLLLASTRREEVAVEPVAMGPIVQRAIKQLHHFIDTSDAQIVQPEHWPSAMGYGPWLEAVWVNYLSNGLKYGGRPPRVELGADVLPDKRIRYWIQDNGDGLSQEEQQQLFTPFTRFAQNRSSGHGLGLSIVQRVVIKLGGTVGVHSAGKRGEGCRFYFTLPAVE
jgi:signal transduction histidine kinase